MMTILKLLVSVILILFLINSGSINLYLIDFSYDNLIIYSFVIFLITFAAFFSTLRLYIIFKSLVTKINYFYLLKINFIGIFFNQFLPGGQGGDVIKILYLIKKYELLSKIHLISCIVIDRLIGLISLFILFMISLLFLSQESLGLLKLFYLLILLTLALTFICMIIYYFRLNLFRHFNFSSNTNYFTELFNKLINDLKSIKKIKLYSLFKLVLISLLIFFILIFGVIIIHNNYSLDSIIKMFFITTITFFSNSIPISFNGLGVGEYVFSELSRFFYNQNIVIYGNIFFIYRILIILSSLPGLIFFLALKNK